MCALTEEEAKAKKAADDHLKAEQAKKEAEKAKKEGTPSKSGKRMMLLDENPDPSEPRWVRADGRLSLSIAGIT